MGVGAAGDVAVVDVVAAGAADALDDKDRLVMRDVGQVGMAHAFLGMAGGEIEVDAVADGPDVVDAGPEIGRDADAVLDDVELDGRRGEVFRGVGDADGNEDDLGVDGVDGVAGEEQPQAIVSLLDLVGFGLRGTASCRA